MKRTISLFSILTLILVFSSNVSAQTGDNTVDASANVLANITIDDNQGVNFGNIDPDLTPVPDLDPTNGNQAGVEGAAIQFGYLLFSAQDGQSVSVTWGDGSPGYSETLTGPGTETIDYTVEVAEGDADQTAATPSGTNTYTALSNGSNITVNDATNAQHTLWIGGTLATTDTTPITAGSYSGTVTFTIDYSL